ncbi:hypothetical protein L7F22_036989 [Adiantum nelumboides]|nr:hypothetical protein [Adiantum nelumboides]
MAYPNPFDFPVPASTNSDLVSPSPSLCFNPDAYEIDDLDDLCKREFGLKLDKLRTRLRTQVEEQQSALHDFCTNLFDTQDPTCRREIAKSFILQLANITDRATDRTRRTLIKMQATFLANVQKENDKLVRDNSKYENEIAELNRALERLELEKQQIADESRIRFEEEKAVLKVELCEELQACQICLHNPRNVVIMPCLHGQFCKECVEAHQKDNNTCPTCRGVILTMLPYIA